MMRALVALAVLAVLTGCGTARRQAGTGTDILTREEISRSTATNAYEAVSQLRPSFLRSRGSRAMRSREPLLPVVYLNDVRQGGVEMLRSIRIEEVDEIRFINAADATTRWGSGHTGGVIQVRVRY